MQCLQPTYRNVVGKLLLTPCNYCINCKKRRAQAWAFRLDQEVKRTVGKITAITLTYADEKLTYTDAGATLNKRDIQLFFKKLRKHMPKGAPRIRYFCAAEYGGRTGRPHYHIILFNSPSELEVHAAWQLGHVNYRNYRGASWIGYCLKYISKQHDPLLKRYIVPPFQLHSNHLGSNYLTEESVNWHLEELTERVYAPLRGGKKAPLHRYYKDKIYSKMEKEAIAAAFQKKMCEDLWYEFNQSVSRSTTHVRKKRELNQSLHLRNERRLKTGITL